MIDPQDLIGKQFSATIRRRGSRLTMSDLVAALVEEGDNMGRSYAALDADHVLADPRWAGPFLDQAEQWQDSAGDFMAVEDMDQSHARNVVLLILRQAPGLALTVALSGTDERLAEGEDVWRERIADPVVARRWILDTPLVKALLAQAEVTSILAPPWQQGPLVHRRLR